MATASLGGLNVNNPQQLSNTSTGVPSSFAVNAINAIPGAHYVGGHLANLVGATGLGHNILSPSVNYLGNQNPAPSNPSPASPIPVPNSDQTGGTSQPLAYYGQDGRAYSTQAAATAADNAPYNLYAGQAQTALQRALSAYNGTQTAINQQYTTHQNELNSALGQATHNYNQGLTQQDQTKLTNDNTIRQGANQGYQSLLRMLGAMGAGGGSEAQYLVPQLVGQNLSQQLGGADQTAAQNKVALTSNFNDYTTNEKKQQQQLNDWKSQQLGQADATYNDTKSKLSNLLNALNAHADSAANLGSQVNNIDAQIPNLLPTNPTYTGITPTYTAPQLSTFETKASPEAQLKANTPNANTTTPYLSLLLGQDQQKKQQLA